MCKLFKGIYPYQNQSIVTYIKLREDKAIKRSQSILFLEINTKPSTKSKGKNKNNYCNMFPLFCKSPIFEP